MGSIDKDTTIKQCPLQLQGAFLDQITRRRSLTVMYHVLLLCSMNIRLGYMINSDI